MKGFDEHKVSSPDAIPMMFYMKLANSLSTPLCILFNKSLKERCFPDVWKTSFVSPIFKDGDKQDVTNYRVVSIICSISKIFERLIFNRLFGEFKNSIHPSQHGFFSKRSTLSNLMEFVNAVTESMANAGQVDALYTDFAKAFDRVSHSLLLKKLENFGFSKPMVQWFKSYLSNRSQYVRIGGTSSERINPTSGIPQGSILGPFLFVIFINDLLSMLSTAFGFADDLKLIRKIVTGGDCYMFQMEINRLQKWCEENRLDLNVKKCAIMTFTHKTDRTKLEYQYAIGDAILSRVNLKRDLGVWLDDKLSFKQHIDATTRKAYQMLGFIFRCGKFFNNPESMLVLYNSLVRSRLEYCSTIWSPFYEKYKTIIERVQRKFTRMYYFKFGLDKPEYCDRLIYMKMHSLESRRLENDEITLYKIIHNIIDTSLSHSLSFHTQVRPCRQQHQQVFYLPTVSSNIEDNEPIHRMQRNHDMLFPEVNLFAESFYSFKSSVKK